MVNASSHRLHALDAARATALASLSRKYGFVPRMVKIQERLEHGRCLFDPPQAVYPVPDPLRAAAHAD
jgi:hypothetical protein